MMRRLLGIAVSTLIILLFAACGGAKDVATDDTDDHSPEPAEVTAEAGEQTGAYAAFPEGLPEEPEAARPQMETNLSDYPLSVVTDDLLVLVNKTHTLTRDYEADDLVTVEHCDPDVGNDNTKKMRKVAADAVEELIAGAAEDGYSLVMRTGYRSYGYQEYLFNYWAEKDGEAAAENYSARPGKSEHQTGLACDIGRRGYGLSSFNDTAEAAWLAENCWKYGFILRFPADKTDITGYIYESWHIRYVGKEAAKIIYDEGLTLEEYLGILN